jgi:hypothetical protein
MALAAWVSLAAIASAAAQPKVKPTLDYEFYKARVEPIFLKKKAGHTRCVICHSDNNSAFKLQALPGGTRSWSIPVSRWSAAC